MNPIQFAQPLAYALQQVAVVVETLLTVALVARQCVLAAALLADFLGKQSALVDVCRRRRGGEYIRIHCLVVEVVPALCKCISLGNGGRKYKVIILSLPVHSQVGNVSVCV